MLNAQSNNSPDCVYPNFKFKFMNNYTIIEKVIHLLVGLESKNKTKQKNTLKKRFG